MNCSCCTINEATVKDYRDFSDVWGEDLGALHKFFVCNNCIRLVNVWFLKLNNAPTLLGKKRIMARITEKTWKAYVIN